MKRRSLLLSAGCVATVGAFAAWKFWPSEGLANPCQAALPEPLAHHPVVAAAWEDIPPAQMWDAHVHLVGTGDSDSGIWTNPQLESLANPVQYAQRLFFLNAGCVHDAPGRVDQAYVERMHNLVDGLRPGAKLILLAFDHTYDEDGKRDEARSAFHTPDEYAQRMASVHSRYFEWACSVHPYRRDCVQALEWAAARGARAVKWLPAAMGMDPSSARCDPFYAALARLDLPLLSHAGLERAVHGSDRQDYGNPLKLRRALEHGVRVVVAHCATMGQDRDLDAGPQGPLLPSFELFARMMDEPRSAGRLYGDLSAVTQANRAGPALARIIERTDWHERLLNGSDYPLPGILPLFSLERLVQQSFLRPAVVPVLQEIRARNPLLFDFVLKRELRAGGKRLSPAVFRTRRFFDRHPDGPAAVVR
jgi:predicted TIM-barrel fold metal-dependent hydrolase